MDIALLGYFVLPLRGLPQVQLRHFHLVTGIFLTGILRELGTLVRYFLQTLGESLHSFQFQLRRRVRGFLFFLDSGNCVRDGHALLVLSVYEQLRIEAIRVRVLCLSGSIAFLLCVNLTVKIL